MSVPFIINLYENLVTCKQLKTLILTIVQRINGINGLIRCTIVSISENRCP
ncbi:hypothetical protein THIOM_002596 [Candidatus Thiomargarita nelsonii]|uniref:Uncharacterized protein n=1 Tax=Candidatus Thiomargarita nelsonii TaxID=1003181 RepID=A0A176S0T6_9GAMM|nr:hypothetical protein THIOM_002596 [Candidatus Thiomargarita nelsonii]